MSTEKPRLSPEKKVSKPWPLLKKLAFGLIIFLFLFFGFLIFYTAELQKEADSNSMSILPNSPLQKDLDYDFISMDTMAIPNYNRPIRSEPAAPPVAEDTPPPQKPSSRSSRSKVKPVDEPLLKVFPRQVSVNSKDPNMIVMNRIDQSARKESSSDGFEAARPASGATLIKVVLPQRTAVATGSLVEARVLRDSKWRNTGVPRRTRIIGVASLTNRRVNIDFREIIINNDSRSCNGRAYDNKQLQGIAYTPVSSEAKRVLMEELRDAVSGVPVVGRYANRASLSSTLGQDITQLDEGLEFYVLINSIF